MPATNHTTEAPATGCLHGSERRVRYLNGILTVNAVLLAAIAWTNLVGTSTTSVATAAPQSSSGQSSSGDGFPNATAQRLQLIAEVKGLRADLAEFESAVSGGRLKVVVGNPGDIKLDIDYAKLKAALKE